MRKIMLLVLGLGMVGGCSLKSDEPPPVIYALRAQAQQQAEAVQPAQNMMRVLHVARPDVPPGFDTDRIALYRDGGQKLDYYAGVRWPDVFDVVMQDFLTRAAAENLPYVVATGGLSVVRDARLQVKVMEFQPVYRAGTDEAPEIVAAVEFNLLAVGEERILDSFILSRRQRAAENRLDVVMETMNRMMSEMTAEAFVRMDPTLRGIQAAGNR